MLCFAVYRCAWPLAVSHLVTHNQFGALTSPGLTKFSEQPLLIVHISFTKAEGFKVRARQINQQLTLIARFARQAFDIFVKLTLWLVLKVIVCRKI